jgi:hypothetical protein
MVTYVMHGILLVGGLVGCQAAWLWLVDWLAGWQVRRLVGWLGGLMVSQLGWLGGWLAGRLAD